MPDRGLRAAGYKGILCSREKRRDQGLHRHLRSVRRASQSRSGYRHRDRYGGVLRGAGDTAPATKTGHFSNPRQLQQRGWSRVNRNHTGHRQCRIHRFKLCPRLDRDRKGASGQFGQAHLRRQPLQPHFPKARFCATSSSRATSATARWRWRILRDVSDAYGCVATAKRYKPCCSLNNGPEDLNACIVAPEIQDKQLFPGMSIVPGQSAHTETDQHIALPVAEDF